MKPERNNGPGKIVVVTGIDTGIGKTVVTGLLARWLQDAGQPVITMKAVQTGCERFSEDIAEHRKLAGIAWQEADALGLTCPYVFPVPCSPHLAAHLDGGRIDPQQIVASARSLAAEFNPVLLEGAGGLFVPLNERELFIDLLAEQKWPIVLVTGPRLGSINHTLAALEAIERRGIPLQGVVYNLAGSEATDPRIVDDSRQVFSDRIRTMGYAGRICDLPAVACTPSYCVDFSPLFPLDNDCTR
ncbi:MAG: dethiobiotin synthase [Desulfofustis sp.]|jgi:dethiobiotin synthetase|nr:dethiobiotin synthase [Desulfofustis sp.]